MSRTSAVVFILALEAASADNLPIINPLTTSGAQCDLDVAVNFDADPDPSGQEIIFTLLSGMDSYQNTCIPKAAWPWTNSTNFVDCGETDAIFSVDAGLNVNPASTKTNHNNYYTPVSATQFTGRCRAEITNYVRDVGG